MSATLTWSDYHGESNLQSTFAATTQGAMQLLNQYLTALAAFADFPWQICSTELTTSPWYITLKRKSGAPGRIIIVGIVSSVGATMNPQLTNDLAWTTGGIRIGWFPVATTDTPANIIAASGNVFTGTTGYTGLSPNTVTNYSTNSFSCWGCEDGIFLRYGTASTNNSLWVVGDMMEDSLGAATGIAFSASASMDATASASAPNANTVGGFANLAGTTCHFGAGWTPTVASSISLLRDNAAKKIWLVPRAMYSFQLPLGDGFKYKLRQIAFGPTSLAGFERIAVDGDITKAMSTFPTAAAGYPWLANYQV